MRATGYILAIMVLLLNKIKIIHAIRSFISLDNSRIIQTKWRLHISVLTDCYKKNTWLNVDNPTGQPFEAEFYTSCTYLVLKLEITILAIVSIDLLSSTVASTCKFSTGTTFST